jgi:hypothetical protein
MNMRFSTQAANADVLGDDTPSATTDGMSDAVGADGTPRDRADRRPGPQARPGHSPDADAEPVKDRNAAGLVKDKDAAQP